jgi:hypothetical protein
MTDNKPPDCEPVARRKPGARSRVTNGKQVVAGVDGRSLTARRYRDLVAELCAELGGELGQAELLQIRTVASLVLHGELLTAAMINGDAVNSEELTRVANGAARLLAALRRRIKPKPGRPSHRERLLAERGAR